MKIFESKKKEILISKAITGIMIIYLLFNSGALKYFVTGGKLIPQIHELNSWFILKLVIFIFQIFLIIRLIYPKQPKINFINFNRSFHPFFFDKNQKKVLNYIFGFPIFLSFVMLVHILSGEATKEIAVYALNIIYHFFILKVIIERQEVINTFPVQVLKSNNIRFLVKYQDYINHKIADDEPHLTINQNFDVSLKSLPRNDSEKNLIEIKNPNTPINPALVYNIKDKDLADVLRDGYVLRAKLIEIKEEGNLEIELSLKETNRV